MGFTPTNNRNRITAGDLEYIPDRPDFIDGASVADDNHTNEVHSGELPSEQDPRDKVEESDDHDRECESFELIFTLPEAGDMTDLIEHHITDSRIGAVSDKPYTGKPSNRLYSGGRQSKNPVLNALLQMQDKSGNWRYKNEAEAALNYNLFDDKNVQKMLNTYGLSNGEIKNFADIRQHQLDTAKQKAYKGQEMSKYGFKKPLQYSWGQGAGVNFKVSPKSLSTAQQAVYNRMSPQRKNQLFSMSPLEQQKFWSGMQSKYPQYFQTASNAASAHQQAPATQQEPATQQAPAPQRAGGWSNWPPGGAQPWYQGQAMASRSLGKMRNHVNLVGGVLAMPRTAAVLRQAVELISAVRELDDGKSLDETTRSALRNTSRNLLMATDHLKGVNNRIANRVAGEIEQLYVDALSN